LGVGFFTIVFERLEREVAGIDDDEEELCDGGDVGRNHRARERLRAGDGWCGPTTEYYYFNTGGDVHGIHCDDSHGSSWR
jgi:hypothetical protein